MLDNRRVLEEFIITTMLARRFSLKVNDSEFYRDIPSMILVTFMHKFFQGTMTPEQHAGVRRTLALPWLRPAFETLQTAAIKARPVRKIWGISAPAENMAKEEAAMEEILDGIINQLDFTPGGDPALEEVKFAVELNIEMLRVVRGDLGSVHPKAWELAAAVASLEVKHDELDRRKTAMAFSYCDRIFVEPTSANVKGFVNQVTGLLNDDEWRSLRSNPMIDPEPWARLDQALTDLDVEAMLHTR